MRKSTRIILLAFAALHLFFICLKSFREYAGFRGVHDSFPALVLAGEYYTQVAVMQADYSFFSPEIAPDYTLSITLQRADSSWIAAPLPVANREVEVRLHSCLLGIQQIPGDLQQIIAKSWAARVLDQHPEAKFIRVVILRKKPPTLAQFRDGARMRPEVALDVLFDTHS